jgi:transcriptional regulator with XRE-family HTH domain
VEPLSVRVGSNIKRLRESRNMTQESLALIAEVSKKTLVQIEKGKTATNLGVLARIASALKVDPAELLGGVPAGATPRPSLKDAFFLIREFVMAWERGDSEAPVVKEMNELLRPFLEQVAKGTHPKK